MIAKAKVDRISSMKVIIMYEKASPAARGEFELDESNSNWGIISIERMAVAVEVPTLTQ